MGASRFRRAFYKLVPSWLSGGEGERVLYSLHLIEDAFVERCKLGVYARFPEHAPEDALAPMGRDRKIVRGIDESAAGYAARLVRWLDDHRTRGNPFALLEQLRAYCNCAVRVRTVDRRGNWFTIDRDGTRSYNLAAGNWNWDTLPASPAWARFWVIIYPTAAGEPWAPEGTFGDGVSKFGEAGTIGTTATEGEVAAVQAIIREWKPAGTHCEWVVIAFDDSSFDPSSPEPDGTWGPWSDDSDPRGKSRLATARYWDGVAA